MYRNSLDRTNCGFRHAELLQGNIGYVQLNYFGPRDVCAAAAAVAMKAISHADAIIFDMRQNHGGDTTHQREQSALRQALCNQPAAGHAERKPHSGLTAPSQRAGKEEIGDVRARDEQDDQRHAAHPAQRASVETRVGARRHLDRPGNRPRACNVALSRW